MTQHSFLQDEEFVFGQHETHQRPIAEIERRAGIRFGGLAEMDALRTIGESFVQQIESADDIVWRARE